MPRQVDPWNARIAVMDQMEMVVEEDEAAERVDPEIRGAFVAVEFGEGMIGVLQRTPV